MSAQSTAGLAAASGRTSLLMGLGVIAKLAVDVVVIASFGLTSATDALFVAYTLLIIVEALLYPACQSGLVPVFVGAEAAGGRARVRAVLNSLVTLAAGVGLLLATAGVLGSGPLTRMLAPGLDAETGALAARLAALMLAGLLFVPAIGVMRAFLNARGLYAAPASIELMRGATVVAVVGGAALATGSGRIEAVAAGFGAAALVKAVVLGAVVRRHLGPGYRPAADLRLLREAGVQRMLTLPLLEHGVGQGVLIAERVIGSFLPAGSISAISYGHRLASVVGNTLFTGVEVVSLSSLAASLAGGSAARLSEARATLLAGVRLVVVLGVPVGAAVWAVREPVTRLLFERGGASAGEAALVLGVYALTIPLYGYLLVARSYLFAGGRPLVPLLVACAQLAAMVAAGPALAGALGAPGVAGAYALGQLLACAASALALGGVAGHGQGRELAGLAGKVLLASAAMAGAMGLAAGGAGALAPGAGADLALLAALALAGAAGGAALAALLLALQVEEARALRAAAAAAARRWAPWRRPGFEQEA